MLKPHPSVVEAFRRVSPRLTVEWRGGDDPWSRWAVCEPVRRLESAGGGVYMSRVVQFPVLLMPNGTEIDQRAIKALWESKWCRVEDPGVIKQRKQDAAMRELDNQVEAWARGPGHWAFKKQFDQYAFSTYGSRDPSRKMKEWEDEHGKRWGPL